MPRLFIAGASGLVGQALLRRLSVDKRIGSRVEVLAPARSELDLTDQSAVARYFDQTRPDYVILAAGRVGGLAANIAAPAEFIYQNMMISANVIHQAHRAGVKRLLNLGSSCIYPRDAPQPMREEALLSGPLDGANTPYAVAKIAAITLCASYRRQYNADFRSLMPANLYGPCDNFDATTSHVIPALIRRFSIAVRQGHQSVDIWGSGRALREFLHVDDLAIAALFVLGLDTKTYWRATGAGVAHLNVGSGQEVDVRKLAKMIADCAGFSGQLRFDTKRPEGVLRKVMDSTRLTDLGWAPTIKLEDGIKNTLNWFGNCAKIQDVDFHSN